MGSCKKESERKYEAWSNGNGHVPSLDRIIAAHCHRIDPNEYLGNIDKLIYIFLR